MAKAVQEFASDTYTSSSTDEYQVVGSFDATDVDEATFTWNFSNVESANSAVRFVAALAVVALEPSSGNLVGQVADVQSPRFSSSTSHSVPDVSGITLGSALDGNGVSDDLSTGMAPGILLHAVNYEIRVHLIGPAGSSVTLSAAVVNT